MTISMKELWGSSHVSAGHAAYLESLYETFINDPENLSKEWLDFFTNLPKNSNSNGEISHQEIIKEFRNFSRSKVKASDNTKKTIDERQGRLLGLFNHIEIEGI